MKVDGVVMESKGKTIQSVQRAIDIMNCIADSGRPLTLREISRTLELNENTVRGLIQTLQANGMLARSPSGATYSLGYDLFAKGQIVYEEQLREIIAGGNADLAAIAEQFNVSTSLQVSFHHSIYTVEAVEAPRSHYAHVPRTHMDLPLHASASGKLLLAYLPEESRQKFLRGRILIALTRRTIVDMAAFEMELDRIAEQGYATEQGELSEGFSCVAVPFFAPDGTLRGSMSAVAASTVLDPQLPQITHKLQAACSRITTMLSRRRLRSVLTQRME